MIKTIEQINREIELVKQQLADVKGTATEVYTRIVGYHRNVDNWNKGKREEYKFRRPFTVNDEQIEEKKVFGMDEDNCCGNLNAASDVRENKADAGQAVNYKIFTSQFCRNCPPVKDYVKRLNMKGEEIDVSTDIGISLGKQYNIMSTPTVLFFDETGNTIYEAHTVSELKSFFIKEKVLA